MNYRVCIYINVMEARIVCMFFGTNTDNLLFDKMPPKRLEMGKYGLVVSFVLLLTCNRIGFVVSHEYANEVHTPQVQRTSYHFQPLKNWMNGNTYIHTMYIFFLFVSLFFLKKKIV